MKPLRWLLVGWFAIGAMLAHADKTDAAERARIDAERRAIEGRFAAEEAACRERFVVTACVEDTRVRRRQALAGPRHQELLLDDAARKRRAQARLEAVEARRAAAAALPPSTPLPDAVRRNAAPPAPAAARAPRPVNEAAEAAAAARRASAAAKRREELAIDQARIESRQAQREAAGKKAAPLPLPASAVAPR
jgi:hypothetical protein